MNNASIPPQKASKTAGIAIASLVLGIMSFVCMLGPILGIPAIITGHIARKRVRNSGGALDGEGLGLAGLIIGYVNLGLSVVMIPLLAAIAIPNFIKARDTAQHNACVNNLRQLDAAKQQWAVENKKEETDTPEEDDISPYLKAWPACPKQGSYSLNSVEEAPTCSIPGHELEE